MNVEIWRMLTQILSYRNDLIEVIRPFFENLKNENIHDEKFDQLLKTFSKYQIETLYKNGIITEEKVHSLIPNTENQKENRNQSSTKGANLTVNENNNINIDEIISDDKTEELKKLILEKDLKTFNTIKKSFLEVEERKIPLIQYCIQKNAIECFKYLLVNGYDDPNKTMIELNQNENRHEFDCLASAIFFGNKEIIGILEDKGIQKGKNASHIEAAILSYRNHIAKEIVDEIIEKNEKIEIEHNLSIGIISSSKNNNIKGGELLIRNGANINTNNIIIFNESDLLLRRFTINLKRI